MVRRARNTTGAFEVYDISKNAITSAVSLGQVGLASVDRTARIWDAATAKEIAVLGMAV